MYILHKLVHLCNPFVVFLKTCNLPVQQIVLFVAHLEVFLEAVHVCAERTILLSKLRVEVLLEVEVSLHVGHFAVPKIEFASLLLIILLHQGDSSANVRVLDIFFLEIGLKGLNSDLQCLLVRVESCSERFSPLSLFLRLDFFELEVFEALLNLVLLGLSVFKPELVLLLATELDFLEVLKSRGEVSELPPELSIFNSELVYLFSKQVHLVDGRPVTIVDV